MSMDLSKSSGNEANSVVNTDSLYTYNMRIPFPNELYAESAMKAIGVDPPF